MNTHRTILNMLLGALSLLFSTLLSVVHEYAGDFAALATGAYMTVATVFILKRWREGKRPKVDLP
jgi:uncharacterized membrane protein